MPTQKQTKAIVIGAGIGGLTAAVALRRVGVDVEVYERAPELHAAGTGLSVMSNALSALRTLGIELDLEERGRSIESFRIATADGRPLRAVPLKEVGERLGAPSVVIHRADLQDALLDAAGDSPVVLGAAARRFDVAANGVSVLFEDGREARGDVLIGADGFNSAVRRQLAGPEHPRDAAYVCWLATAPFEHPAVTRGSVAHFWGAGQRFGLIDIGHGRVYWFGTKNMPAAAARDWRGGKDDIARAYEGWADEVQAAIQATPEPAIVGVPAQDRPFLDQWGHGPVTLLGDAAHPMLTSLAQGAGSAMEDAVVLATSLASTSDLPRALRAYERARRRRTKRLVSMSRALSRVEQLERPIPRLLRDAYLRHVPLPVLRRQNQSVMTFPGYGFGLLKGSSR